MKKIAITCGVFDCLHEGHINLLNKLREEGERVIVFVHDDNSTFKNKGRFTVQKLDHRSFNLLKSGLVDEVFPVINKNPGWEIEEWLSRKLQKMSSNDFVYIRGNDWMDFPGRDKIAGLGIEIKVVPYTEGVSTTLIRKEKGVL